MSEITRISRLLTKSFEKNAWHGPSVREVLAQISPADSKKRLPNTHSIIELVAHMTAWRVFAVHKLSGDDGYRVGEEMNFPQLDDWLRAVRELEESQAALLDAIGRLPEGRLAELVPHHELRYTFYTLLHGIIHHDLYHLGQIILIHKAAMQS
ncbi:MAG TPA: DinB family protein [Chryseosolibacter sp.]|nr:DinB family protein [Chryseosolibacter sp.]